MNNDEDAKSQRILAVEPSDGKGAGELRAEEEKAEETGIGTGIGTVTGTGRPRADSIEVLDASP